jgi:hypothetical protein
VDTWYRYYAGYSAGFVEQALKESAATAALVLDPWNGTGTTTVVAASKNVPAIGFGGCWRALDCLASLPAADHVTDRWESNPRSTTPAVRRPARAR